MAEVYGVNLDELAAIVVPMIPEEIREKTEWMWRELPHMRADLPHDTFIACDALKRMWRDLHPRIVQGWKNIKEAAELAVQSPGKTYSLPNKKVMFKVVDNWLYMRLPSGRNLAYYKPRWVPARIEQRLRNGLLTDVEIPGELRYWGVDTYTRQWKEVSTYGGRLVENLTQATARDILVNGMLKLEAAGYSLVMTIHDEAVVEVDKDFGSVEEAAKVFCNLPPWALGCPVVAEGWRAGRYRK
jgi:DNA polymerase